MDPVLRIVKSEESPSLQYETNLYFVFQWSFQTTTHISSLQKAKHHQVLNACWVLDLQIITKLHCVYLLECKYSYCIAVNIKNFCNIAGFNTEGLHYKTVSFKNSAIVQLLGYKVICIFHQQKWETFSKDGIFEGQAIHVLIDSFIL